jgi:hypothetical protein
MGLVGIEAVIDAMILKLQTDMPAKVTALNTEYADDYVLADIADSSYYWWMPKIERGAVNIEFPAIVLINRPAGPGAQNPSQIEMHFSVVVDVLVRGESGADVSRRVWRYNRAVKEILAQRHSLADVTTTCTYMGEAQHETTDSRSGDYLHDFGSLWEIMTSETT